MLGLNKSDAMIEEFGVGSPVYYVPECDSALAQYVPVTRVHSSLRRPLLTLGKQLVIAPKLKRNGMLARDKGGSYWISKEAFEAQPRARTRAGPWTAGRFRAGQARLLLDACFLPKQVQPESAEEAARAYAPERHRPVELRVPDPVFSVLGIEPEPGVRARHEPYLAGLRAHRGPSPVDEQQAYGL